MQPPNAFTFIKRLKAKYDIMNYLHDLTVIFLLYKRIYIYLYIYKYIYYIYTLHIYLCIDS